MLRGFVGLIFFTVFALANSSLILKLKKPEQILLSAAIISAPWSGGIWVAAIRFDFRLTYIFLLGAFLMGMKGSKRYANKIPQLIVIPFVFLIVWTFISGLQAYNPAIAMGDGPVTMLWNLIYLLAITKLIKKQSDLDFALKSAFIGLFYTCVLALLQYKIRMFEIGFIDSGIRSFMWWRPRATFMHPNAYGMYQLIIIPIVFRQVIIMFRVKNTKMGSIYLGLLGLSTFTLLLTQNRGSWLGLAAAMVLTIGLEFFRRGSKKTRKVVVRVILIFLVLSSVPLTKYGPRMYDRLFSGKNAVDKKALSRSTYNKDAWIQLRKNPVWGVGVSNVRFYSSIIFTHNLYLLMASETGYPGFIMFVLYMIGFLMTANKTMKSKNPYVSSMGAGFLTTILALLIASYPGPDYAITPLVSSQLWIIGGMIISLLGMEKRMIRQQKIMRMKKRQEMAPVQEAVPFSGTPPLTPGIS